MRFYAFCSLPPVAQVYGMLRHNAYLVNRWYDEGYVNLCQCSDKGRGFFIEAEASQGKPVLLGSFAASGLLADYAHGAWLPV